MDPSASSARLCATHWFGSSATKAGVGSVLSSVKHNFTEDRTDYIRAANVSVNFSLRNYL